jgi:hypothetical protein
MTVPSIRRLVLLALLGIALLPAAALAAGPKVLQVISVKVSSGDRDAYYAQVKSLQAVSKRLGMPAARVWRASLAGEDADTIYIATEYESLAAMGAAQDKVQADAEWTKLLRALDASGIRTVVGRSLMVDETPQ